MKQSELSGLKTVRDLLVSRIDSVEISGPNFTDQTIMALFDWSKSEYLRAMRDRLAEINEELNRS